MTTRLGIGTARFAAGVAGPVTALRAAGTTHGVAVVDTAASYANGAAEAAVGHVLSLERAAGAAPPPEVITKSGYLASSAAAAYDDAVAVADGVHHSMAPAFLRSEIERSVARLGAGNVGAYLLHNPEHALAAEQAKAGVDDDEARAAFGARLEAAFSVLEGATADGLIGGYGVSSGALASGSLPWRDVVAAAEAAAAGAQHRLTTLQLPLNALEPAGAAVAAEVASHAPGVRVVAHRVLTAMLPPRGEADPGGTFRLVHDPSLDEYAKPPKGYMAACAAAINHFTVPPPADGKPGSEEERETADAAAWLMTLVKDMNAQLQFFTSPMHLHNELHGSILPMVNDKLGEIDATSFELLSAFFTEYEAMVKWNCASKVRDRVAASEAAFGTPLLADAPLHAWALQWAASQPGIDTVLVGATHPDHVAAAVAAMPSPAAAAAAATRASASGPSSRRAFATSAARRPRSRLGARGLSSAAAPPPPPPVAGDGLLELVLVRHGESEGNLAWKRSKYGDSSLYDGEFMHRHTSRWRLTDRGRRQATTAGEYLRSEYPQGFDRYCTSEYLRAMETAGRLDLHDASWHADVTLRERDWGQFDLLSAQARQELMGDEMRRQELDAFLYSPPSGESLAQVAERVDRFVQKQHTKRPQQRIVVVCHGEVMWALRTRIERLSLPAINDLMMSARPSERIHNGQVVCYSRVDPETGEVADSFQWTRSVCPWNNEVCDPNWRQFDRPTYTNDALLTAVANVPRLYSGAGSAAEEAAGGFTVKHAAAVARPATVPDDAETGDADGDAETADDAAAAAAAGGSSLATARQRITSRLARVKALADAEITTRAQLKIQVIEPDAAPGDGGGGGRKSTYTVAGVHQEGPLHEEEGLDLQRVLLVNKMTRYEYERLNTGLAGSALHAELELRGIGWEKLKRSSDAHAFAFRNLTSALDRAGVAFDVVAGTDVGPADVEGVDAIVTAGGDGTFLRAAAAVVAGDDTPIIGVNTDPMFSTGALCAVALYSNATTPSFDVALERLSAGDFRWQPRRRLEVKLVGEDTTVPQLVTNEVFFAEADVARPSIFDVGVDRHPRNTVRCSGILACTGTGSSGWYRSATSVHREDIERILGAVGVACDDATVGTVTGALDDAYRIAPTDAGLAYVVREPVENRTHTPFYDPGRAGSDGGNSNWDRVGRGMQLSVKSLGWSASLCIDGGLSLPLAYGAEAIVSSPDHATLRTVCLGGLGVPQGSDLSKPVEVRDCR